MIYVIGFEEFLLYLSKAKFEFLLLAFVAYMAVEIFFMIRLKYVFGKMGKKVSFSDIFGAQMGAKLGGDITPGRSGYLLLPFILEKKIPIHTSFGVVLGIQAIEFLVKSIGAVLGLLFLIYYIKLDNTLTLILLGGIAVMLFFSFIIALALWSKKAVAILKVLSKIPIAGRLSRKMIHHIEEIQSDAKIVTKIVPQVIMVTIPSWVFKGLEWTAIGLALGISQLTYFAYFLLHPLITALAFVPLTPSGLGIQEGGIVLVFVLLGVGEGISTSFAILSRAVVTLIDLIGLIFLIRVGPAVYRLLFKKKLEEAIM